MATDKRISYTMQGHKKPARNYLGKQKTVKNIPVKWKSGPKTPETELAYITKAEKNLLLKKDLHGSLKHGPNTGPDGIMSLDSQGDYTRDRSPGSASRGRSPTAQANEAHMRSILTGQKNIGQTAAVSDRTRQGAVPEWGYTPSGERKYVGSSVKGKQGWISRLLGRGNVKGTRSLKFNPTTGRYESEDEELGDIQPGFGGRILGGLGSLLTGIPIVGGVIGSAYDKGKGIFSKKPRDMTQFNELSLTPYNERKISIQNDMPMESLTMANWGNPPEEEQTFNNQNFNMALPMGSAEGGRIGYERGRVVNPGGYQGEEEGVDSIKHFIMLEQMDKLEKMIGAGLDSDGRLQAELDRLIATPTTGLGTGPDLVLPDDNPDLIPPDDMAQGGIARLL